MNCLSQICLACCFLSSTSAYAGTLRTVALSGQQVPSAPDGTVFGGFSETPVLNDAGQTAFLGGSTVGYGVWSEGSGSLELVAAQGQQAPGMPDGVTYGPVFGYDGGRIVINEAGITAFIGSASSAGYWSVGPGNSQLLAVSGQQAAGLPDGVR